MQKLKITMRECTTNAKGEDITKIISNKYHITPGLAYTEGSIFEDDVRKCKVVQVKNDVGQIVLVPIYCFEEEETLNQTAISPYKSLPHTKHH